MCRGLRIAALAVSTFVVAPSARADEHGAAVERQVAQSLFERARTLLEAGRVAEACPKFAESQRMDPGGGTLLNLALCLELDGKLASATTAYEDALALAIRDGRRDRESFAREHLTAIAPRLSRIVVSVAPRPRVPVVTLDGSQLRHEAWGTSVPVDPGSHRVIASEDGATFWSTAVEVREPGRTYDVDVPVRTQEAPLASKRERSVPFWTLLATGSVAIASGAVFGVMALDANKAAAAGCIEERAFCTQSARRDGERARTFAWLSTGTMIGGVALGAVAFVLPWNIKLSASGSSVHMRHEF